MKEPLFRFPIAETKQELVEGYNTLPFILAAIAIVHNIVDFSQRSRKSTVCGRSKKR